MAQLRGDLHPSQYHEIEPLAERPHLRLAPAPIVLGEANAVDPGSTRPLNQLVDPQGAAAGEGGGVAVQIDQHLAGASSRSLVAPPSSPRTSGVGKVGGGPGRLIVGPHVATTSSSLDCRRLGSRPEPAGTAPRAAEQQLKSVKPGCA